MTKSNPTVLCILDGWGESPKLEANAVALGKTPNFDTLSASWPTTNLSASGSDVGLPDGQIGNSEVGHLNLGAGRLVLQTLPRISAAMAKNQIQTIQAYQNFKDQAVTGTKRVHLLGLLSPGGVHAHSDHLIHMVNLLKADGFDVCVHAFADGRDGPAKEISTHLPQVEAQIGQKVTSLMGRYYAMDRDKRWDRTSRAFATLVEGHVNEHLGQKHSQNFVADIQASYDAGISDEFLDGLVDPDYRGMNAGDSLLAINFRADRMRQILSALLDLSFDGFDTEKPDFAATLGMISYSKDLNTFMPVLFGRDDIDKTLGQVVSEAGFSQIRAAETEKYPHVTYFFNGGREQPFEGEHRLMVNSPKVATYDLQPEMSAPELCAKLLSMINDVQPDLVVVNFANPDMVGHTGDLNAAIKAVEAVDVCLGDLADLVLKMQGKMLVLADHGNCETMKTENGKPHTAHTLNPVPLIGVGLTTTLSDGGRLADVGPTLLTMMNLDKPVQMDGRSLIRQHD